MEKIKLAHLQLLPIISGVQTVTLEEFSSLDGERYSPALICKEKGPLTEAAKSKVHRTLPGNAARIFRKKYAVSRYP